MKKKKKYSTNKKKKLMTDGPSFNAPGTKKMPVLDNTSATYVCSLGNQINPRQIHSL